MTDKKAVDKQTFIAEARRAQIVDAAIATLDEIGFANASLAQIAKRAGISTALISYHFKDKNDLMDHTLMKLLSDTADYVTERTRAAATPRDKLHAYIASSLAYQSTRPKHNTALIEIVFHARTPDDVPYYKLNDDEDDPLALELQQILRDGQTEGQFRPFNVLAMASAIQGAIGEYSAMTNVPARVELESYCAELVNLFDKAVLQDGN